MALVDEVQTRIAADLLVQLTRQGDTDSTTADATRLAAAATDAAAEFELRAGVAFDATLAKHVPAGVDGVLWLLHARSRQNEEAERYEKAFAAACERVRITIGGNGRVLPQTSSQLTPSDEVPSGTEVRPDFDRANLGGTFLRAPRSTTARDARPEA